MLILSCQFVIPKTEKKEIKTEIKQEPGIHIKQEIDDRAHLMTGMEVPDFLMENPANSPGFLAGLGTLQPLPPSGINMSMPGMLQPPPQIPGLMNDNWPPQPPLLQHLGDMGGSGGKKRKKEKKKKKNKKHKREDRVKEEGEVEGEDGVGKMTSGESSSGSNPASPTPPAPDSLTF